MAHFKKVESVKFVIEPGCPLIDHYIREAIEFSRNTGVAYNQDDGGPEVSFEFEGVTVTVKSDSDFDLIYRYWLLAWGGYITDIEVGPYPHPTFSREDQENCAHAEANYQSKLKKIRDEELAELAAQRAAVEDKLANAPALEVRGEGLWQMVQDSILDPAVEEILDFAERWARLMQLDIEEGNELEEVFETCANDANFDNLNSIEQSVAAMMLSSVWIHGEQLSQLMLGDHSGLIEIIEVRVPALS